MTKDEILFYAKATRAFDLNRLLWSRQKKLNDGRSVASLNTNNLERNSRAFICGKLFSKVNEIFNFEKVVNFYKNLQLLLTLCFITSLHNTQCIFQLRYWLLYYSKDYWVSAQCWRMITLSFFQVYRVSLSFAWVNIDLISIWWELRCVLIRQLSQYFRYGRLLEAN